MNARRSVGAFALVMVTVAFSSIASRSAFAQTEDCNPTFSKPITDVAMTGLAVRPTPTRDGCWLFAGFVDRKDIAGGSGISLMRKKGETFEEIRTVPLPLPRGPAGGVPSGLALTPDEKVLVISHSQRVTFFDVEKFKSGGDPVLGYVEDPRIAVSWGLTLTRDGAYAFAAQQRTAVVAMIDLARARVSGFDRKVLAGFIPTSPSPISLIVSPDGNRLFVANRNAPADVIEVPRTCSSGTVEEGVVQIVDLERAKTDVASATIGFAAPAGCGPQNLALSPDGVRLSVTAGGPLTTPIPEDNAVVLFDTRPLRDGKMPTTIGRVPMPASPVLIEDAGSRIIVGFLNQQKLLDDTVNLLVIDPSKAGAGKGAIVGKLPFPASYLKLAENRRTLFASRPGTLSIVDLERVQLQPAAPKE
jgi:DNA-binding beta-propeller fold protein YncE